MPFIYKSMFPDSNIAHEFTFSETKSMYVLAHGITPYIESLQINNIKESKEYVLLFDETLNKNLQKTTTNGHTSQNLETRQSI